MTNQIIIARQFRGTELFFAGIIPNGTDWSSNRERAVKFGSAEGLRPILDAINAFSSDVQAYARDVAGNVLVPAAAAAVAQPIRDGREQILTDLEFAVFAAIDQSEYGDEIHSDVWTFSVAQYFNGRKNQLPGAVASLVKKGFLTAHGSTVTRLGTSPDEAYLRPTEAGVKAYLHDLDRAGNKPRKTVQS